MQYRVILLTAVIVLTTLHAIQVTPSSLQVQGVSGIGSPMEIDTTLSECTEELGELVMSDEFASAPLGFNSSLWNLITYNNPTLTWLDGESQILNSEMFTFATLESTIDTGVEVIAEFNMSFTKGQCYFGIGWSDRYQDPEDEWISNLRVCQNGVFIDYWDQELFLVSYSEGQRVATTITDVNIAEEHQYRLVWSKSLVRLSVDGIGLAQCSRHIPSRDLPFIITTSGHHYRVDHDQLRIDSVRLYSRELCHSQTYPQISLVWPQNGSTVLDFDKIDLEIEGEIGPVRYSWDGETNSTFLSPWDIEVPMIQGVHRLEVFAEDTEGGWSSLYLEFTVIKQELTVSTLEYTRKPLIDGIVEEEEKQSLTMMRTSLRGEDRSEIPFDLYFGYFNESLYVAAITTLQDRYHSRISLFIDGQGNGIWGDIEVGMDMLDICITAPTPSADPFYMGINTHYGSEVHPIGVVYDCGLTENGVTAEFLIPVDCVGGNSSIGLGIGLVVAQGGYNSFYPARGYTGEICSFLIVRSSGPNSNAQLDDALLTLGVVTGCFFIAAGYIVARSKRTLTLVEETLDDEQLERIRTLLHSHPEITLNRLALLANIDTSAVKTSIDKLVERELLTQPVVISDRGVVRVNSSSEKTQK